MDGWEEYKGKKVFIKLKITFVCVACKESRENGLELGWIKDVRG